MLLLLLLLLAQCHFQCSASSAGAALLFLPSPSAPTTFSSTSEVGPTNLYTNLYYSVELPGVFKSISLTGYSIDHVKNGFDEDQEQYKWLEQELDKVMHTVCYTNVKISNPEQ